MVFSDIYLTLFFPWCVIFVSNSPSPCCWPSLAFSLSLSPVQNAISPSSPFQKKPFPFHRQPSEFLDQDDNNHVIVHKNRKCWKISVGLTASVETEWSQYFGTLRNFGAILSSQMLSDLLKFSSIFCFCFRFQHPQHFAVIMYRTPWQWTQRYDEGALSGDIPWKIIEFSNYWRMFLHGHAH